MEKKYIFAFLNGLNKSLNAVRGRMIAIKPLPLVQEVFAEVRREESKRKVTMRGQSTPPIGERSALFTWGPSSQQGERHGWENKIADGSLLSVMSRGTIVVSSTITLNSMLYVPTLPSNLLSISKITNDLNCVTKFFPHHCEFQDMDSKKIGNDKEYVGLNKFTSKFFEEQT